MNHQFQTAKKKAGMLAGWGLVVLGVSIPISTALDNVLLAAILLLWVVSARYREKLTLIRRNPIAVIGVALFVLFLIGLFYGDASWEDALDSLKKAAIFLFIGLFMPLSNDRTLRYSIYGFLFSMTVTLFISYLIWFNAIPPSNLFKGMTDNPVVFKMHITQSLLMAFTAFLLAIQARFSKIGYAKIGWSILCALALFNVLFMIQGRTGQLVLVLLIVYFLFNWLRWKGSLAIIAALLCIGGIAYFSSNSALHQRTALMLKEFSAWDASKNNVTSVGQRLEFYVHTLPIIRDHPIAGVGTGGFAKAYEAQIKNTNMAPTQNPHNEYLMVATQLGIIGLAAVLFMFYRQWHFAKNLNTRDEAIAKAMLLAIIVGSLVSSTLMDHTEGLFYAWMSALLFAGLRSPILNPEGHRE